SLSSGEYLPGSLQGKISSDGCLKKEQMVVSAIASTPQNDGAYIHWRLGNYLVIQNNTVLYICLVL
ncbi:hypothetical protein, partial [Escherichia coli]|uniref:hypothetical protein n=1 Tax=Escherichia coli TaxID=562 RepID=UPI002875D0DA